jgi:hypothetical protein
MISRPDVRFASVLSAGLLTLACSSSEDSSPPPGAPQKYLGLETPANGFQIRSLGTDIPVGMDLEFCEVAQLPGAPSDTYHVNRFEFGNGTNSHHLIVMAATPGGPAEAKLAALGVGNSVPCLSAESAFGEMGFEGVGGSQQPYVALEYPEGVGRVYHGGQYVVFDYHYLNTSQETVQARSAVNFHVVEASSITNIADGFAFSNLTIDTPPGQRGSFKAQCHFETDLMVSGVARHTHRWGTTFSVKHLGGARDGQVFWTSEDWEHDTGYSFEQPLLIKAGEGFEFQCDYQNTTDKRLRFGTSATDEMCILFGTAWGATPGQSFDTSGCQAVWVDSAGMGHPADEAGGFPAPTATETQLCLGGQPQPVTECAQCQCDACGAPIVECAVDTECRAALECLGTCTGDDCAQRCIDPHSSGLGLLSQMQDCIDSRCTACR